MKLYNRILVFAASCLVIFGCNKDNTSHVSSGSSNDLDGCTALYNGESTFSEIKTTDLIMYSTEVEGEYYIPKFFQGDGGLEFYWDSKTNDVRIKIGYAGVSTALTEVEVAPQADYEALTGAEALKSFYDPATKTFTFNVLMITSDGEGNLIKITTTLYFKITSEVK